MCYFLWSMQTIPINQQRVVFGSGSFFPPLSPPVPALISWVPSPGCGGVRGKTGCAFLLSWPTPAGCRGEPGLAWPLSTHPIHVWVVGWVPVPGDGDGRSMAGVERDASVNPQVQAPGVWGPKGTAPAPGSLSCSLTWPERLCNFFSIPWRWSEEGADG